MTNSIIEKYFPHLSSEQKEKFAALPALYEDWNSKINVISRKDIEQIEERHILHSLAIAKYTSFTDGTKIIDVGTGGGFPGIPLAIMFPNANFLLIDSIGKKIKVVEGVAQSLGLANVRAMQTRSEQVKEKFDFIVSRAVTAFPDFVKMTKHLVSKDNKNACANGIIYLKGGDFEGEIARFGNSAITIDLTNYFSEEFFETKKIIHLAM
ncbi:MAG: 16S rRNA (guanine(527)-N(7))-methyltransferase RsmG [Bacteroidales bacterium]|nr:16S rRNA (guanine(527)-N(7))-methyltransferase RsmG [Bacteroidales bacterium]